MKNVDENINKDKEESKQITMPKKPPSGAHLTLISLVAPRLHLSAGSYFRSRHTELMLFISSACINIHFYTLLLAFPNKACMSHQPLVSVSRKAKLRPYTLLLLGLGAHLRFYGP